MGWCRAQRPESGIEAEVGCASVKTVSKYDGRSSVSFANGLWWLDPEPLGEPRGGAGIAVATAETVSKYPVRSDNKFANSRGRRLPNRRSGGGAGRGGAVADHSAAKRTLSVRSGVAGASMERMRLLGLDFSALVGGVASASFHSSAEFEQVRMSR